MELYRRGYIRVYKASYVEQYDARMGKQGASHVNGVTGCVESFLFLFVILFVEQILKKECLWEADEKRSRMCVPLTRDYS